MFPCAVVATPITSARSSFSAIVKLTAGDVAACPLRNVITPTAPPIDWTPVLAATSILFSSLDIALLIVSVATIELLSVPFYIQLELYHFLLKLYLDLEIIHLPFL